MFLIAAVFDTRYKCCGVVGSVRAAFHMPTRRTSAARVWGRSGGYCWILCIIIMGSALEVGADKQRHRHIPNFTLEGGSLILSTPSDISQE